MKKLLIVLLALPLLFSSCITKKKGCDGLKENLTLKQQLNNERYLGETKRIVRFKSNSFWNSAFY